MFCCAEIEFDRSDAWCYRLIKQFISIPIKSNPFRRVRNATDLSSGKIAGLPKDTSLACTAFIISGQMK